MFRVPSCIDRAALIVIATVGGGWDHVSVSRPYRPPNWAEMNQVKDLFFEATETVMQLHVPAADHVDVHLNCLHLWRAPAGAGNTAPARLDGGAEGMTGMLWRLLRDIQLGGRTQGRPPEQRPS